ncbi:MAG: YceI family protein [Acidobacteria bacterium]|nr:YceI family protein [Acidobacteriota bacterium]
MTRFLPLLILAATLQAEPITYSIDGAHTNVQFTVRHMGISNVKGTFQKVTGQLVWDPANLPASKLEATIDINSIDTRQAKRDAHLKSADFFDAAKFPTMTFQSKAFRKTASGLNMSGDLTIRGVTKPVTFAVDGPSPEVKDQMGSFRMGASATAKINRKDFGLSYNAVLETGGFVVGDEVTITIDVELVRRK